MVLRKFLPDLLFRSVGSRSRRFAVRIREGRLELDAKTDQELPRLRQGSRLTLARQLFLDHNKHSGATVWYE
jgi:hypothetical protein